MFKFVVFFLLLLTRCVNATLQFVIATDECPVGEGGFNSCDETKKASLCGSADDTDNQWCCEPLKPSCYAWGKTCTSGNGKIAGTGQLLCKSGTTTWCCNSKYEVCTTVEGQINICLTNYENPYHDTSPASASSLKSEFLAQPTASSTRSLSTVSFAPTTSSSSAATTSNSPAQQTSSSTGSSTPSPSPSSSGLSAGAIAGIVIGAVVLLAAVGAGAFFLGRKKRSGGEKEDLNPEQQFQQEPLYQHEWHPDHHQQQQQWRTESEPYKIEVPGSKPPTRSELQ